MQAPLDSPILLAFVADLNSATRIETSAQALGFEVVLIESLAADPDLSGALMERVTLLRPALIVFDLANEKVPFKACIARLRSDPATRRIPLICFGPHLALKQIQVAQEAGAQAVYARSRFFSGLPELIQKHARRVDKAALAEDCLAALSAQALHGLELFNLGEFFEAHEWLEEAWKADPGPARELYRAILQTAVAYLQIERLNFNGAVKMFLRLRQWIDPLPQQCRGVDVATLRQDSAACYAQLLKLGPDQIQEFDHSLFKPVIYQIQSSKG